MQILRNCFASLGADTALSSKCVLADDLVQSSKENICLPCMGHHLQTLNMLRQHPTTVSSHLPEGWMISRKLRLYHILQVEDGES